MEHYENPRNVGALDKNDDTVGTVRRYFFGRIRCRPMISCGPILGKILVYNCAEIMFVSLAFFHFFVSPNFYIFMKRV